MRALVLPLLCGLLAHVALASPIESAGSLRPTTRLANGNILGWGKAKFVVRVERTGSFCTGSLIAPRWVLLAGHCKATVGSVVHTVGGTRKVVAVHQHWGFKQDNFGIRDDVALVRMDAPAPPPTAETKLSRQAWWPYPGKNVQLFGFGAKNDAREGARILRTATLTMISANACRERMQWPEWKNALRPDKQFCINEWEREAGICDGDSGGPLRVDYLQVAIASYRLGPCGSRVRPDVFVRVEPYINWIQRFTGPLPA